MWGHSSPVYSPASVLLQAWITIVCHQHQFGRYLGAHGDCEGSRKQHSHAADMDAFKLQSHDISALLHFFTVSRACKYDQWTLQIVTKVIHG